MYAYKEIKIRYIRKYNIYLCQKRGSIPWINDETFSNEIRTDGEYFMFLRMPLIIRKTIVHVSLHFLPFEALIMLYTSSCIRYDMSLN